MALLNQHINNVASLMGLTFYGLGAANWINLRRIGIKDLIRDSFIAGLNLFISPFGLMLLSF